MSLGKGLRDVSGGRRMKSLLTAADENLVCAIFVAQLGSIALPRLKLDGYLLLVEQVGALKDDAEGALANLLPDAVVDAHDVGRGGAGSHGGCSAVLLGVGRCTRSRRWRRPQPSPEVAWGLCRGTGQRARGRAKNAERARKNWWVALGGEKNESGLR